MAQIQTNPWSFAAADASFFNISSITQVGSLATLTTSAPHGFAAQNNISVINPTIAGYAGFWPIIAVPTTTTLTYQVNSANGLPLTGLANSGAVGNVGKPAWGQSLARIEDISWLSPVNAGDTVIVTDKNGNTLWKPTAAGAGVYQRGKLFWVEGFWLQQMSSGTLIVTVG